MYTFAQAQLDKYRFLESLSHSAEAAYTYKKQIEYWERIVKAENQHQYDFSQQAQSANTTTDIKIKYE